MAGISMMQKLLDNALVSQFAKSLKHSDLPEGWADNPEIVQLAEDAYREMGTESPWFKAWNALGSADVPVRVTHATKGVVTRGGNVVAPFDEFKKKHGGIYTLPKDNPFSSEILDTLGGSYPYEYDLFTNAKVLDFTLPPKGKKGKTEKAINSLFSRQEQKDIREATGEGYWDPVRSFYDGDLWPDTDRATQDAVIEKLRREFDAEAIKFNDNPNYGWDSQSVVVFDPKRLKSTSNRGTFNPADPNIYKGIIPAVGAGGLLALMGAEEAEAAPKPWNGRGVSELVGQLENKDFKGALLDKLSDNELAELARKNPAFTEPQHSIDGDGVEHLYISRMVKPTKKKDRMTPDQVGDVVNSLTTSSRRRVVTTKGDKNGEHKEGMIVPHGESTYLAVLEPQDGKAGIYTAFRTKTKDLPKQMGRSVEVEGGNPHLTISPAGDLPTQRSLPAVTSGGNIPEDSKLSKAIIPLTVGGVLVPRTAEAYQFPADKRGTVLHEPALESPIVDPIDILLAPIGAVGAGAKAAAMVAEPFISYGMDKAINGLLGLFDDEEE